MGMKKTLAVCLGMILTLAGCAQPTQPTVESGWASVPMVMVNGTLYLDTGIDGSQEARCGMMDGEITSQVESNHQPTKDDQSNFGIGMGYQYGSEGTIEVNLGGTWRIFATEEVRQQMQFPDEEPVLTEPPALTVVNGQTSVLCASGNFDWYHENADGTRESVIACGAHPLESLDVMPQLNMRYTYTSALDPRSTVLQFETEPDEVTVCCWSEECWGDAQGDDKREAMIVTALEEDPESGKWYVFHLKEGSFIYEVTAKWDRPAYGGVARYCFYTLQPSDLQCGYPLVPAE